MSCCGKELMIFGLLVGDNPRLFYLGGLRREAKTLTPPTPSTQTASQLTSEIWRPAETDPGTYFPSQLGHISTRFTPSSWIDHDRVFCSTFHFNKSHFLSRIKTTLRASTLRVCLQNQADVGGFSSSIMNRYRT